jgi:hypothetical protein
MPKLHLEIAHDIPKRSRRAKVLVVGSILILGVLLVPVLAELGSICLSQWHEVMGKSFVTRTPILDAIQRKFQSAHEGLSDFIAPHVQSMTWDAYVVFPILLVLMVLAVMLLRK